MEPETRLRNEAEPARKFKGVWICAALWFDKALNPTQKFLIAEIDSLTGKGEPCFAGNKYLADHLHTSEAHMRDMLAELTARGYLIRLGFTGRHTLTHLSQLAGSASQEAAPELHRGQKVCTTRRYFRSDSKAFPES